MKYRISIIQEFHYSVPGTSRQTAREKALNLHNEKVPCDEPMTQQAVHHISSQGNGLFGVIILQENRYEVEAGSERVAIEASFSIHLQDSPRAIPLKLEIASITKL